MSACPSGKLRFRDRIGAMMALADCARKDAAKRREVRAYRCPLCRGWHLTSRADRQAA